MLLHYFPFHISRIFRAIFIWLSSVTSCRLDYRIIVAHSANSCTRAVEWRLEMNDSCRLQWTPCSDTIYLTTVAGRFPSSRLTHQTSTAANKVFVSYDVSFLARALNFKSLAITLCTTNFDIQKFCMILTLRECALYGHQKKTTTFTNYIVNRLVLYNWGGECLLHVTRRVLI